MRIMDAVSFFDEYRQKMFYVGFMKVRGAWFPVCSVSDPHLQDKFDSLYISLDYTAIRDLVESLAARVAGIQGTFVHFLLREEVENIMETYALKHVVMTGDEEEMSGCACGCGCGHALGGDGGCAH